MTIPEPGFTSPAALLGGLAVLTLLFGALWLASLPLRDASLVDRVWGMAFVVLAVWYAWTRPDAPMPAPGLAVVLLVSIWGLRLSIHLTRRNWGRGEDYR